MSLWKKASLASVLFASSIFATGAQAAQIIEITGPSGTFGDSEVMCGDMSSPCTFTRTFEFVTPAGFNLASADISSIATINPMTNIDFSTVTLNGVNFNTVATGTTELRNLFNQSLQSGGINVLNVTGMTGGNAAFSGTLSFASVAAVPEPTTWMLMLLGMAGIGYSMRRKSAPALRVRYT